MDHGAHSISTSVLSLLFLLCIILVFKLTSMVGRWSPMLKGLLLPPLHWRTQRPTSSSQKSLALFCGLNLTPSSLQWAEYESWLTCPSGSIWSNMWSWTIQCECWDPNTLNHQASSPVPPTPRRHFLQVPSSNPHITQRVNIPRMAQAASCQSNPYKSEFFYPKRNAEHRKKCQQEAV